MIAAEFIDKVLREQTKPRIRRVYFSRARYGLNWIRMAGWCWVCGEAEGMTPLDAYNNWADAVRGDGR